VEGRQLVPWRAEIADRNAGAGQRLPRAVEGEHSRDRPLAPQSQVKLLVEAMVCEFRADSGGGNDPGEALRGVIQPSACRLRTLGLAPPGDDNSAASVLEAPKRPIENGQQTLIPVSASEDSNS